MLVAALADIHGNLHALAAVLREVRAARVDRVVVLGDLVGYNAEPGRCVELVREHADVVLLGNHDQDAANGGHGSGTQHAARVAQDWTRAQLDQAQKQYLRSLPRIVHEPEGFVAVHGCYLNDVHYTGYVTSTMLDANLNTIARAHPGAIALCGHTHIPMLGFRDEHACHERRPIEVASWPRSATAVLINPGAVGQPRDHDPRASFALIDTDARTLEVRRVVYDVAGAVRAIEAAGLPPELGHRLKEGR